ncbi:hypothetical protein [Candidatus Odyssella acanthamoebae]|nr:hypothetical protein [Candidatus Paracaedibacter acanthamoebae]
MASASPYALENPDLSSTGLGIKPRYGFRVALAVAWKKGGYNGALFLIPALSRNPFLRLDAIKI